MSQKRNKFASGRIGSAAAGETPIGSSSGGASSRKPHPLKPTSHLRFTRHPQLPSTPSPRDSIAQHVAFGSKPDRGVLCRLDSSRCRPGQLLHHRPSFLREQHPSQRPEPPATAQAQCIRHECHSCWCYGFPGCALEGGCRGWWAQPPASGP